MNENEAFFDELQRDVDADHRRVDGASAPPAGMWKSIRAQVNLQPNEANQMSSITMTAIPVRSRRRVDSRPRGGIGHYLNLAATIALVVAVAVAGWFATMQVNQSRDPEPRLAATLATPESAERELCAVEPLTVDEAIQIVKNPFVYMGISDDVLNYTGLRAVIDEDETKPGVYPISGLIIDGPTMNISNQDRQASYETGNQYLDCMQRGTQGQIWRLTDPIRLQHELRGLLPLFVTQEEARAIITEVLEAPAVSHWNSSRQQEYLHDKKVVMNPDHGLGYNDDSNIVNRAFIETLVIVPIMITDGDGETVFAADFGGFPFVNNGYARDYATNIALGKSELTGEWYVLGFFSH